MVALAGAVFLSDCLAAIAQGSGQELWDVRSSGQLFSVASGLCAAVVGDGVSLVGCDAALENGSQWEAVGSGQLQLANVDACLTQQGLAAGVLDLAPAAAASASSTASVAHGLWCALVLWWRVVGCGVCRCGQSCGQ